MKLKRIGIYRATRILSWVLPVVIVAFLSIAAWSYLARTRDGQPFGRNSVQELPPGIEVSTTGLQYVATEGEKNLFLVKASKMLSFKDNRKILEDVEVIIYAQKAGDPDRWIRGAECTHIEKTNNVACRRNVSVELEPGTIAHTEQLSYDPTTGLISSPVQTSLDRAGEMTGNSGRMDYFVNAALMRLTDNFNIDLTRGGGMRGGIAAFDSRGNWVTVSQGLELTSGNGRIRGGNGRAELLPGTYRPKKVTVEAGASAEAPSFNVNSDWLQSDLSDAGDIEHVIARGNVRAERKVESKAGNDSDGNSLNGTLTGPEVEAWLENGNLKTVEARQNPTFDSGSGGTLTASETIRIEPAGVKAGFVRTAGTSNFKRDGLDIEGRNFTITVKDDEHAQTFETVDRATLRASGLTTTANKTTAQFNTKTKTLAQMVQTGNVAFEEKGGRTGSAGKLTVRDDGNLIELEERNPEVTDAQGTLYAPKITLDRNRESFIGEGGPSRIRMTTNGSGKTPVVIFARRVEGRFGEQAARVDYTGDLVEMYPGDGTKVEARKRLTLFPRDKRFEAEGGVRSTTSDKQVVEAEHLEFGDSPDGRQIARYKGKVSVSGDFDPPKSPSQKSAKKVHLELRSNDLDVESRDGILDKIIATGAVDMIQGMRKGKGSHLTYDVTTGAILLTGTKAAPAEVSDADGSVRGCIIEMAADGKREATSCEKESVDALIKIKN